MILKDQNEGPFLIVLGISQDGGFPQAGCIKKCCSDRWSQNKIDTFVSSLALVLPEENKYYIFDCTPDFKYQLAIVQRFLKKNPDGVFLTHAHMGHYTGLLNLGRECMNTRNVDVFCFPKMSQFLTNTLPFSQLVNLENIKIRILNEEVVKLSETVSVEAFLVEHRGEISETAGFRIKGPKSKVVFIPDIDSWDNFNIKETVRSNDLLLLDGTFFSPQEINHRNVKEIPHPFIDSSIELFDSIMLEEEKNKIKFIHFNHTNPLLDDSSQEYQQLVKKGYGVSKQNEIIKL